MPSWKALLLVGLAVLQTQAQQFEEGAVASGPKTDAQICENLVQQFYREQDDGSGTSLIQQNDSCKCQLNGQVFEVTCRLDYCPECNSAGVCGVWIFRNRYQAGILQQEGAFDDLAMLDDSLLDFAQCVEYVQGRDDTICTTTSSDGQTCTMDLNGKACNSCRWDGGICQDPNEPSFSGGFVYDCQNLAADGGVVFNSCNEVTGSSQAVALDSAFASFDDQSLQFVSCYDASVVVATPPPTSEEQTVETTTVTAPPGDLGQTPEPEASAAKLTSLQLSMALAIAVYYSPLWM